MIAGIDIGTKGAITFMESGSSPLIFPFRKPNWDDISIHLDKCSFVGIENSLLHPKSGKRTWRTMGVHQGFWEGICFARNIEYDLIMPRTWVAALKLPSKTGGAKHFTMNRMRKLFPTVAIEITEETADSVAIAYYIANLRN